MKRTSLPWSVRGKQVPRTLQFERAAPRAVFKSPKIDHHEDGRTDGWMDGWTDGRQSVSESRVPSSIRSRHVRDTCNGAGMSSSPGGLSLSFSLRIQYDEYCTVLCNLSSLYAFATHLFLLPQSSRRAVSCLLTLLLLRQRV